MHKHVNHLQSVMLYKYYTSLNTYISKAIHFDCVFTVIEVVFSWCLSTFRTQKELQ